MIHLEQFSSHDLFIATSLEKIANAFRQREQDDFLVGLSGGSTPFPVYEALAKRTDIDFSKVIFALTDERYVPATHPDSNQGSIRKALLETIERSCGISARTIFFDTEKEIEDSVRAYEKQMEDRLKDRDYSFDLLILGIGPDGHIASLFPGSTAIFEKKQRAVTTKAPREFAIEQRLSITLPVILQSKKILVLLSGAKKKPIIEQLFSTTEKLSPATWPAAALLSHPDLTVFYEA